MASRSTSPRRSAPWTSPRPDGASIPIEERKANEVLFVRGVRIAPPDTDVRNPAFDVTPSDLITGIVTDEGVLRAPYAEALAEAVARRELRRKSAPGFAAVSARRSRRSRPSPRPKSPRRPHARHGQS